MEHHDTLDNSRKLLISVPGLFSLLIHLETGVYVCEIKAGEGTTPPARSSVVLEYLILGIYVVDSVRAVMTKMTCLCIWTSRRVQLHQENLAGILMQISE